MLENNVLVTLEPAYMVLEHNVFWHAQSILALSQSVPISYATLYPDYQVSLYGEFFLDKTWTS